MNDRIEIGVWSSVGDSEGDLGSYLNCGELGFETYAPGDVLLGMIADEDEVIRTFYAYRESQSNGGAAEWEPDVDLLRDFLLERAADPHPMLTAALDYAAERGWKSFPARMEDGKKYSWLSKEHAPGGENWGMTNDPKQLQRNFTNPKWRSKCGVGVPTGWVNRIFDIEGDTKAGHGVDGLASLAKLEAKYGRLPDTLMAESPTGSLHRIYKHPGHGIKVISRSLPGYPGVDIKGDGGMFVAPPSVRGDGEYRWLNDLPIADAPQWLLDLVTAKGNGKSQPQELPKIEIAKAFKELKLKSLGEGIEYPTAGIEEIHSAANAIPPSAIAGESKWMDFARALAWEAKMRPERKGILWEILDATSRRAPNYDQAKNRDRFERYIGEAGTGAKTITIATLFHMAHEHEWQWWNSPTPSVSPTPITWDPTELRVSFSNVRHRPWLYGPYLMRGEVTIIAAPGGVGKTALTTGIATAIATGTVLMDDKIWGTNLKVLSINGEDGKAEVTRRMWAFARAHAHQIAVEAPERFYAIGAEDDRVQRMSFLRTERNTSTLDTTGFAILESALDAICPDVVMLDPFVVFCSGGNMNDGPVMAQVMRKLKSLAIKYDCSMLIVHHNRKGGERDDQESISGAASIVNLARCAIMPVPMTKEEAKEFEVLPSERHRYFRLVNAKPNFTPKSEDSPWYQLHNIEIPNPEPPLYEYGDNVQAVARVSLPLPKTAAEAADDQKIQKAILDLVEHGKLIEGERYPYNANVTGAKNMRAVLDDAMAAVRDATPLRPRPWPSDDLRAVVHAAIDKMKVEGQLFEGGIEKGRFRGASALYVKRSNPASPASGDTAASTPEEAPGGGGVVDDEPTPNWWS